MHSAALTLRGLPAWRRSTLALVCFLLSPSILIVRSPTRLAAGMSLSVCHFKKSALRRLHPCSSTTLKSPPMPHGLLSTVRHNTAE
eukprot:2155397-Pyramimonas_sp.AAC.1